MRTKSGRIRAEAGQYLGFACIVADLETSQNTVEMRGNGNKTGFISRIGPSTEGSMRSGGIFVYVC